MVNIIPKPLNHVIKISYRVLSCTNNFINEFGKVCPLCYTMCHFIVFFSKPSQTCNENAHVLCKQIIECGALRQGFGDPLRGTTSRTTCHCRFRCTVGVRRYTRTPRVTVQVQLINWKVQSGYSSTLFCQKKAHETFKKYKDCNREISEICEREAFLNGFRLGARIIIESVNQ